VLLNDDAPAAIRWESFLLYSSAGPIKPGIKTTMSDCWKNIESNFVIGIECYANGEEASDFIYVADGILGPVDLSKIGFK